MTGILDGITIDQSRNREEEAGRAAATDRLAVTTVRKLTLVHNRRCKGDCLHRNHRRDHHNLAEGLAILGLDGEPAGAGDYQSALEWASMSRADAAVMTGKAFSNAS